MPFQADIVLREMRAILSERNFDASKDKTLNRPVVISTLAAIGIPKLKILATEDTVLFRTVVNPQFVREQIIKSQSKKKLQITNEETKNDYDEEK